MGLGLGLGLRLGLGLGFGFGVRVEQAVLLEEGAHERLRLVEVGGGHHGEEVVLRLQRDVAGEHLGG